MNATETIDNLFAPPESTNGEATLDELAQKARAYLAAREMADMARRHLQEREADRENAEVTLLTALKAAGLKSIAVDGGTRFSSCVRHVFALPPKADPEKRAEAIRWLSRVGGKDLIQRDVHHSSLGSFLRERLERGLAVTPLIVDTELTYVQVRKE